MKWLRGKMQKSMALAAAVSLCVFAAGTDCLEPSAAEAASIDFSSRGSITVTLYSEETGSLVTDGA
ncbi:MAG: hypothetical protein LUF30_03225 [Lachnospiraceae bacterium]|nr:hypothetical protein [Lachnospiraceae bacterium]